MQQYALIGFPLAQSMSKEFFEKFFRNNNINAKYQNIELEHISNFSKIVAQNKFSGFNITIPYKKAIIPFLDDLDEVAKNIGAVNTIKVKEGKLIGYNTDVYGFRSALLPLLKPYHKNALILGTGGAAAAVRYVLNDLSINLIFISRSKTNANLTYSDINRQIIENNQIIINATPVGMLPKINELPPIPYEFLTENHILFDLICKPAASLFLQKGKEMNATVENGLKMFYAQAKRSYEIWT
jgi:shikimate dehydrogenase